MFVNYNILKQNGQHVFNKPIESPLELSDIPKEFRSRTDEIYR